MASPWLALALALVLGPAPSAATAAAVSGQETWLPRSERPRLSAKPSDPTPVFVNAMMNKISNINAVEGVSLRVSASAACARAPARPGLRPLLTPELVSPPTPPQRPQTFNVDAYVYLAFRDDRINATAGFADGDTVLFEDAWEPCLELINVAEGETSEMQYTASFSIPSWIDDNALIAGGFPSVADAKAGSWVLGQSRQKAILTAKLNLAAFPYDKQETGIIMESTTWESRDLKWVPVAAAKTGIVPQGDKSEVIGGWTLRAATRPWSTSCTRPSTRSTAASSSWS